MLPGYWRHQDIDEDFNEWCEVPQRCLAQLQKLLDVTWKGKRIRDRTGQMPTGLRLVKAHRVENRDLWQKYRDARKQLAQKRPNGVEPVNMLDGDPLSGFVKTSEALDPDYLDRLITPLNELYLWHGTSPEGAAGISKDGFRLSHAGAHGLMFGRGAYFAECCSKSDEYASDDKGGLYQGMYALLLLEKRLGAAQLAAASAAVYATLSSAGRLCDGLRQGARRETLRLAGLAGALGAAALQGPGGALAGVLLPPAVRGSEAARRGIGRHRDEGRLHPDESSRGRRRGGNSSRADSGQAGVCRQSGRL